MSMPLCSYLPQDVLLQVNKLIEIVIESLHLLQELGLAQEKGFGDRTGPRRGISLHPLDERTWHPLRHHGHLLLLGLALLLCCGQALALLGLARRLTLALLGLGRRLQLAVRHGRTSLSPSNRRSGLLSRGGCGLCCFADARTGQGAATAIYSPRETGRETLSGPFRLGAALWLPTPTPTPIPSPQSPSPFHPCLRRGRNNADPTPNANGLIPSLPATHAHRATRLHRHRPRAECRSSKSWQRFLCWPPTIAFRERVVCRKCKTVTGGRYRKKVQQQAKSIAQLKD
ncbi:hypothetical protein BDA96_10G328200 [Sorghum bicolor]|uniref:Uncharacterized protein n=2 Tax=Sorghum bicolor TaxID=4558 RepID=A0A921U284_SORBI|nr:hypothetical protein BDA96_10G328200 [Sorghum bicolor]KXG20791.1 hypothetical protein SORBI_3010G253700 [Sorghum bicolor]